MTALSFNRVVVLMLASVLMSMPARAQSVDVDYDKSVDFRAFKTYALGTVKLPDDANPLMVQRIVTAVDSHMSFIGFRKVETAPDVRIVVRGTTREELVYTPLGYGWGPYGWGGHPYLWGGGWYPYWGAGYSGVDVRRILVGTLTLDMIDTRTDRVVFRGTAEDRVSSKAKKNEKKAYEAVAEIFEESPWGKDFDED
jgi:hypothetical protein